MKTLAEIKKAIETSKARSAWAKGVKIYALEMLDDISERADYEGKEPESLEELKDYALNGASDWKCYSFGGSSLIYDNEIAKRLCTASELKKTDNGNKEPNKKEMWLDVQARALYQAYNLIKSSSN